MSLFGHFYPQLQLTQWSDQQKHLSPGKQLYHVLWTLQLVCNKRYEEMYLKLFKLLHPQSKQQLTTTYDRETIAEAALSLRFMKWKLLAGKGFLLESKTRT